jgi:hypothetical protein
VSRCQAENDAGARFCEDCGARLETACPIDLRNALLPLGDWARMGDHLRAAEGLARTLGDQHRLARIATIARSRWSQRIRDEGIVV